MCWVRSLAELRYWDGSAATDHVSTGGQHSTAPVSTPGMHETRSSDAAGTDVVQIHHRMAEPLHTLFVASALCIDTALQQDDRGRC
jgi:hypothetical protein